MTILRLFDWFARDAFVLAGFRTRRVPTTFGEVHVYDAPGRGTGPPVVLVHGIGANASNWGFVLGALRRRSRRVVMVDLLGHGFSDDPEELTPEVVFGGLGDALDALIDEPSVLIGNSLGGGMALGYALMRPERLRHLVLLSPGGAWMEADVLASTVAQFRMETVAHARDFVERLYARSPWYAEVIARGVVKVFARPSMRRLLDSMRTDHLHTPETVAALRVPTLLVWGKRDRVLPADNASFFKTWLPPGTVIAEPDDWGHVPQLEAPGPLLRLIGPTLERS